MMQAENHIAKTSLYFVMQRSENRFDPQLLSHFASDVLLLRPVGKWE